AFYCLSVIYFEHKSSREPTACVYFNCTAIPTTTYHHNTLDGTTEDSWFRKAPGIPPRR
ncbi:hypothetical protein GALMADRAFT_267584, partial [Galerina marginata CBS 339.88]